MFLRINVSYIDTSRGLYIRRWRKYVQNRRACYCLWHCGKCGVWGDLLGGNIVLIVGNAFMHSVCGTDKSVPYEKGLTDSVKPLHLCYRLKFYRKFFRYRYQRPNIPRQRPLGLL